MVEREHRYTRDPLFWRAAAIATTPTNEVQ
jgi:hypothetical protein